MVDECNLKYNLSAIDAIRGIRSDEFRVKVLGNNNTKKYINNDINILLTKLNDNDFNISINNENINHL